MTMIAFFSGDDRLVDYLAPSIFTPAISPFTEDISAVKYLRYAEADYNDDSERGLINALGNAKRALHLIVDYTLHAYGLLSHVKRGSFPQKLQMLDHADLLPISILRQLNLERNLMEHEYGVPPKQRVAEAIDVTKILLLATRKIWESVLYECTIGIPGPTPEHAILRLYPDLGSLRFFHISATENDFSEYGDIKYLKHARPQKAANSVTISNEHFREIHIRPSNVDEWSPWIRILVKFGVGLVGEMRDTHTVPTGGTLTTTVTIPVNMDNIDQMEAFFTALESSGLREGNDGSEP
jgi:hypothetical protein